MTGLRERLEAWIDRAGAFVAASGALESGASARAALAAARARAAALERPLRTVLVGGTGTGKSTIINAIAGKEVSAASRVRPTTTEPAAYVHESFAAEAAEFAPGLRAVTHSEEALRHLLLVDLPDFDSRALTHRALVDALLPLSDQVVWVVDPDKYNDGLLHREYLAREARLRERFVVVFNKTDAIAPPELALCLEDLAASLRTDRIQAPAVFPVSAAGGIADPGFSAFSEFLRTRFTEKYVRELKSASVFRTLRTIAADVALDLGIPTRQDQVRAEDAAISGRGDEFRRWLRLQLGPEIFSPSLVQGIRDRLRDRFASLLPGPVGMAAEWRFRAPAARDWRELAGMVRAEASAAAGRKVHSRIFNDASDGAAWFRRLPERMRPSAPPDEEAFGRMRDAALTRLEESLAREHEGEGWRGRGKIAQHVLPAAAAGGVGTTTILFAAELATAGALAPMLVATGAAPVGLYVLEAALARREVARAAREAAERAAAAFRGELEQIYDQTVSAPLHAACARLLQEYADWRALQADLSGLDA